MPPAPPPSTGDARSGRLARCVSRAVASVAVALVALAVAFGLSSCQVAPRAMTTVVMASGSDLESANPLVTVHPLSRQVQRHVLLVSLARYDSRMEPEPYFARSWDWSADRTILTMHLFNGLHWHDGVPTTARDAAFTLDAARDPATGYPRQADLAGLRSAVAEDDSTLVLTFDSPQPRFPAVLCELPLVPEHILAGVDRAAMRQAPFGLAPVGNGPFRFVSRTPGSRWVFERDPVFPATLGGPPHVRRLVVAVVDEATTKFAGLVSGELDLAGIAPTMAALVARDPQLKVLTYPVLFSTGMVFNTHRPPFDDVRVRRAIDLSLRRDRIVATAFAGLAEPAAGPVPPASQFALDTVAEFAPATADSLLDAAGWRRTSADGWRTRDGLPLRFDLLTVGSADNPVEQLVQADLAGRGIRMEIRQMEMAGFLAAARRPEKSYDALITGIPGDPALSYLVAMYASGMAGGALDYGDFHTPTLDALLAHAGTADNESDRIHAWREVQRELLRDVPVAWIFHSLGVQGLSARLNGVVMDLRGELATVTAWQVAGENVGDAQVVRRP